MPRSERTIENDTSAHFAILVCKSFFNGVEIEAENLKRLNTAEFPLEDGEVYVNKKAAVCVLTPEVDHPLAPANGTRYFYSLGSRPGHLFMTDERSVIQELKTAEENDSEERKNGQSDPVGTQTRGPMLYTPPPFSDTTGPTPRFDEASRRSYRRSQSTAEKEDNPYSLSWMSSPEKILQAIDANQDLYANGFFAMDGTKLTLFAKKKSTNEKLYVFQQKLVKPAVTNPYVLMTPPTKWRVKPKDSKPIKFVLHEIKGSNGSALLWETNGKWTLSINNEETSFERNMPATIQAPGIGDILWVEYVKETTSR